LKKKLQKNSRAIAESDRNYALAQFVSALELERDMRRRHTSCPSSFPSDHHSPSALHFWHFRALPAQPGHKKIPPEGGNGIGGTIAR
jgi:hypothetical protein